MALLGMEANGLYDGYFTGYFSTTDLNKDASSSTWHLNNTYRKLEDSHRYNGLLSTLPADQVSGYNKEVLKQTMLKHEAMFRDQIHELHRLYRRQRELMNEMISDELYKCNVGLGKSQLNPVFSHCSTEYAQKTSHAHGLPWVNPACDELPISGVGNVQLPLSSIQGKCRLECPDPAQTKGLENFELLESKCRKIGKKILDLQLPADVYIENEEEASLEDGKGHEMPGLSNCPSEGFSQVLCQGNAKPLPGSNELNNTSHGEAFTSLLRKSTGLADLNDPVKPEEEGACNSNSVGPTNYKIPGISLSPETKSAFKVPFVDIVQNNQTRWDLRSCSDSLLSTMKERKQGWPSFADKAGFDREKLSMLDESSQEEIKQVHQPLILHSLNQSHQMSQNQRPSFCYESFGSNHSPFNDSQPERSGASFVHTSRELIHQADMAISGSSPSASSWKPIRDIIQNPFAAQALPCSNTYLSPGRSSKSSITSPGLDEEKFHPNKSLRSSIKLESVSSLQDGFGNSFPSGSSRSMAHPSSIGFDNMNRNNNNDSASEHQGLANYIQVSKDVNSSNDINLNLMPNICSSDVEARQSMQCTDGKGKLGGLTEGLPWLRAKGVCYVRSTEGSEDLTRVGSVFSRTYSEGYPDAKSKNDEASDSCNNGTILRQPIYDKPCISRDQCSFHASLNGDGVENTEKGGIFDTNLTCDPIHDSVKCPAANENVRENGTDKRQVVFRGHVDLNACINEDDSSPTHIFPTKIDLQVPASPENKECSPPRGESDENQIETTSLLSVGEDEDLQKKLARAAAEAIVSISSSAVQIYTENTTCKPFQSFSSDSLHWFAGIVSSVVGDDEFGVVLSDKNGDHNAEFLPDGMDYFEAMTLKLTETKLEACCCKSNVQKKEEKSAISVHCQPRKGRTRRGRQRKDFQSEILPSIVSLSRYEVTEDLQTIGGLMETAGSRRETGSPRNAGRSGWPRGRKRSCVSASSLTEGMVGSPLKQVPGNSELSTERTLVGWGKITRRRRGQRHPVRNPQLILGQV